MATKVSAICLICIYISTHLMNNTGQTEWTAADCMSELTPRCTGQNIEFENKLHTTFPPMQSLEQTEKEPMLVTDQKGNVLVWYLPGLLKDSRQVSGGGGCFLADCRGLKIDFLGSYLEITPYT